MAGDKTKQHSHILKVQALLVTGQDNDKMDAIVQSWGNFYKFGCLGRIMLKHLTFVCSLQEKESFKTRYFSGLTLW